MIELDFTYPDFGKYAEYIRADGNINFVNAVKYEQAMVGYSARSTSLAGVLSSKFYYLTRSECGGKLDADLLYTEFVRLSVPKKLYSSYKNKKGYSVDKEVRAAVIEWIETLDNITLELYILYAFLLCAQEKSQADAIVSSCSQAKKRGLIEPTEALGWNNSPLYLLHNIYYQKVTGRYYAREMPIVGLPKVIRNCFTAPASYFLISMDLRQIDISVAYDMYLRGWSTEYDEIFDTEPEDKYLAMYKIICDISKSFTDIEYYTANRPDIKTNILAGLYQAQLNTMNSTLSNAEINSAIIMYYESNSKYQDQVQKIRALYDLGIPFTVTDAFGFRMDIEVESTKGDSQIPLDFNKVARDSISYVTQSTSNSIKVKWLNIVMERMTQAGVGEYDFWVNMDRHDEIVFTASLNTIKHMPIIEDCKIISIANWGKVRFKTNITLHYDDEPVTWPNEEEILAEINERIAKSLEGFVPTKVTPQKDYTFRGIPLVHDIYIFSTSLPIPLYSEVIGTDYTPSDVFMSEEAKQQECADNLSKIMCTERGDTNYQCYGTIWDTFIIRNTISGKEHRVKGINALPQILEKFDIMYVRVHTVRGDGFCSLGDCYGMKTSLNCYEVISKLIAYEH